SFPQTFSWSTTGTCTGLSIGFVTSPTASTVAVLGVSGTSASVDASQWSQVKGIIGTASTYYWSIGESVGGNFTARASYRSFSEASVPAPNLTPYQPPGWSDKLVLTTASGSRNDVGTFHTNETVYANFGVTNNGSSSTAARFYTAV